MLRPRTSDDNRPFFELQKQPPPKKGRNLKNLAVNTTRPQARAAASTTSLPLPANDTLNLQSIASPSFVKPPTPAKRKPSNLGLTLLTPGSSKAPPQEIRLAIPPTPSIGRPGTLRHFQSSPSLPLFPELSSFNSSLPPISRITTTLETILSPVQQQEEPEEEEEQNFDIPLSREDKPEAYPDGPICVYDPHIDLYLEPTAEQCREYDVILNVASEVRNPLVDQVESKPEEPDIRIDGGGGIQFAPRRDKIPNKDEKDIAHEHSPTTPKATPLNGTFPVETGTSPNNDPEYIHIMWEHNSDIVPDLLRLVKLIDEKSLQGKRVLVHCQCGVSRSASLVVAYGLYKNPTLSVQEAYDAVKKRSKWIGPNMNLIMQLQEFRTSLMRGGLLSANRGGLSPLTPASAISEWRGPFSMSPSEREGPLSASVTKHQASESMPAFSPGPSSAPSGMPWPTKDSGQRARAISAVKPGTAYVSPAGRIVPVVPLLNVVEPESAEPKPRKKPPTLNLKREEPEPEPTTPTEAMQSPRQDEFHLTPLQPSPDFDAADSFGIMSPTTSEFSTNPFDRSALLAQLGMGPVGRQEESPRRSISLRSKPKPQPSAETSTQTTSTTPRPIPRLRGKISSPSIREQQQLQSLQAKISASLPHRTARPSSLDPDDALMSPRATEFTQNPFALALSIPPEQQQSQQQQEAADEVPQSPVADPRSPAQTGISPITRNILDVL